MTYINKESRNKDKYSIDNKPSLLKSFILIITISFVIEFFFPWYLIGLISFVVCFLNISKPGTAFMVSFLAIFLLWIVRAIYADLFFDVPMSDLIGSIFGGIWPIAVFFLTGLIGGIVGGFSGLSGSILHNILLGDGKD